MGLKIAITHVKADFDALASAWAAMSLYNCDYIAISTDMEPNVTSYISEIDTGKIKKLNADDIKKIGTVEHIIITDCKQLKRLGALSSLIQKAQKITVFDHHPGFAKDIESEETFYELMGACTTIVVKKLLAQNISISPTEATLYMLGIYEDTGMLSFSSTTADDARTVASLIELGGETKIITDYVKREFTREQVFVLNELLINMTILNISGVNVALSFAAIDEYVEELAFLAHRMMEMEGLEALVILVRTGPQIVLVGRSKNPMVNMGSIAARFGGGGHPAAASANIRDMELHEAVDVLKITLREYIKPVRFVQEIMSAPAWHIDVSRNFDYALNLTLKHNLNHMPVTKDGKTVGILSRRDILQSIKHGLTQEQVSLIMQEEIEVVRPDTPFRIAEEIMISKNQKLLPVEENDRLVGVVTRTDVLTLMHEEAKQRSLYEEGAKTRLGLSRTRNVSDIMRTKLDSKFFEYLQQAGQTALEERVSIYVVGGFVRDLLMGKLNKDVDLVVEGDGIDLARKFAEKNNAKITVHTRYKTATVTLPNDDRIDFATARTEFYGTPGASPSVETSSLKSDLSRRDFTINAMAIRLDTDFGQLMDFYGGQRDILDKKIRVLHSLSFIDDPTRAFRAIRFAARLGFSLGRQTERLIKQVEKLGLFDRIAGNKLFIELRYILNEDAYLDSLKILKKYGMLVCISENLAIHAHKEEQFNALEKLYGKYQNMFKTQLYLWKARFVLLMADYNHAEYTKTLAKLNVEDNLKEQLLSIYSKVKVADRRTGFLKEAKPSEIYSILKGLSGEELLVLGAILGKKADYVENFIEKYQFTKPFLSGKDLIKMGIPASPLLGNILEELMQAHLNGEVTTKEQEEEFVRIRYKRSQT